MKKKMKKRVKKKASPNTNKIVTSDNLINNPNVRVEPLTPKAGFTLKRRRRQFGGYA